MATKTKSVKKYGKDGTRLTNCCGTYSTYSDDTLCCKGCWCEVDPGEGDGSEKNPVPAPSSMTPSCVACGDYLMPCTATANGVHPELK